MITPATIPVDHSLVVEVWEMTNEYRESQGLPPLEYNNDLEEAADKKSKEMIKYKYFDFTHKGSPTKDYYWRLMDKVGYNWRHAGENLACGQKNIRKAMKALWNSPGHRANILSKKYNEIGISVTKGNLHTGRCISDKDIIIVQMFGGSRK